MSPDLPLRVRLGTTIQRRRAALGLSQEAFADRIGVHRTFMSTVERGLSNLSLDNLERIAAGLGLRPGVLLLEADLEANRDANRDADAASPAPADQTRGG